MPASSDPSTNVLGQLLRPRQQELILVAMLALAALCAYANSFQGPILFDDESAITKNDSIKDWSALGTILTSQNLTTGGRPLVNLSFAANYAVSGNAVWSYHVVNLGIHLLAALVLFGVVRRTLRSANLADRYGELALPLSFLITLLWTVHPLQTSAVTYISQRAESLMALFYLLTLYAFIRSTTSDRPSRWLWLSGISCCCGMMSKEVMVTAPFMVLLYDRVFVSSSFRTAVLKRPWYYAALAASWLLLAYLMTSSQLGIRSVGFQTRVSPWDYALTEFKVVVWYVKLVIWPDPLVFDYGPEILERSILSVAGYVLMVLAALAGTGWLFRRGRKELGFVTAAFFILLSPTSSFVPIAEQPMAESRMYLPLAAVLTLVVMGLHRTFQRPAWYGLAGLAVLLGLLTANRNDDYRSLVAIWTDTVAKFPGNYRGHYNLANELGKIPSRRREAVAQYEKALRIKPDFTDTRINLANVLMEMSGRENEAIAQYEQALRLNPQSALAHNNLATVLAVIPGRVPEAIAHYEAALRSKPGYADAHFNLAISLTRIPERVPEAIAHYEAALRFNPGNAKAHNNLANLLAASPSRKFEAIAHYEAALRLNPDLLTARNSLANELALTPGREADAVAHYKQILRLKPDDAAVHFKLANRLAIIPGGLAEALTHYEAALRLRPGFAEAHYDYANKLAMLPGQNPEAIAHYQAALRLKPDMAEAHSGLGMALAKAGQLDQAISHLEAALRINPDNAGARASLAKFRAQQGRRS